MLFSKQLKNPIESEFKNNKMLYGGKKTFKKKEKNQGNPCQLCKPRLIFLTRKPLNSRLGFN